jgi:hypothetical protein
MFKKIKLKERDCSRLISVWAANIAIPNSVAEHDFNMKPVDDYTDIYGIADLTTGGRGYDMFGTARLRVFEMQFNIDALKETNQNHEQSFENVTKWRDDFLEYRRKINNSDNGSN